MQTPIAKVAEIPIYTMEEGLARMRDRQDRLHIPADTHEAKIARALEGAENEVFAIRVDGFGKEERIRALDSFCMFGNWNASVRPEHRIPHIDSARLLRGDCTLEEKRALSHLPGLKTQGMINTFSTPLHQLAFEKLDPFFQALYGNNYRILPNRFNYRVQENKKSEQDGYESTHIELSNHLDREQLQTIGDVYGVILGISELPRPFTYYTGTACHPDIEDYFYAQQKAFVQPPDEFKRLFTRTRVWCPPGCILVWDHRLMHEVCMKLNLSIYLSPVSATHYRAHYEQLNRKRITEQEWRTHPSCYMHPTEPALHSDKLSILFQAPGYFYPSGKTTIMYYHPMSISANRSKFLPCLLGGDPEAPKQHAEPMQRGVFYDKSFDERATIANECRARFPGIPEAAYTGQRAHLVDPQPADTLELMRYWLVDPRTFSDMYAFRIGYKS